MACAGIDYRWMAPSGSSTQGLLDKYRIWFHEYPCYIALYTLLFKFKTAQLLNPQSKLPLPLRPDLHKLNLLLHPKRNPLHPPQSRQILAHAVQHILLIISHPIPSSTPASPQLRQTKDILIQPCFHTSRLPPILPRKVQRGAIIHIPRNTNTHTMRGLRQQAPKPRKNASRNRGRDIARRIPEVNRVDLRLRVGSQQARANGQYAPAVRRRAFWEDADYRARILRLEFLQCDQAIWVRGRGERLREGEQDGAEERYALYFPRVGV